MRYFVYTDGSCVKTRGKAGAAFLIFTQGSYIGYGMRPIETEYVMDAEFGAITDGAKFLLNKMSLTKADEVCFYSDSLKSCRLCNSILRGDALTPTEKRISEGSGRFLLELFATVNAVKIIKVKAHKEEFNPNKFVDKIAKYAVNMG